MASDRPDPGEFFEMAQRMLRDLFGDQRRVDDPWAEATRRPGERPPPGGDRELSPERQRENLTFALATRAVEALEDLALDVAAIRQRLERTGSPPDPGPRSDDQARARTGPTPSAGGSDDPGSPTPGGSRDGAG